MPSKDDGFISDIIEEQSETESEDEQSFESCKAKVDSDSEEEEKPFGQIKTYLKPQGYSASSSDSEEQEIERLKKLK